MNGSKLSQRKRMAVRLAVDLAADHNVRIFSKGWEKMSIDLKLLRYQILKLSEIKVF